MAVRNASQVISISTLVSGSKPPDSRLCIGAVFPVCDFTIVAKWITYASCHREFTRIFALLFSRPRVKTTIRSMSKSLPVRLFDRFCAYCVAEYSSSTLWNHWWKFEQQLDRLGVQGMVRGCKTSYGLYSNPVSILRVMRLKIASWSCRSPPLSIETALVVPVKQS